MANKRGSSSNSMRGFDVLLLVIIAAFTFMCGMFIATTKSESVAIPIEKVMLLQDPHPVVGDFGRLVNVATVKRVDGSTVVMNVPGLTKSGDTIEAYVGSNGHMFVYEAGTPSPERDVALPTTYDEPVILLFCIAVFFAFWAIGVMFRVPILRFTHRLHPAR